MERESNKLLAEFMGLLESSIPNQYWTKKSSEGFGRGQLTELKFHTDWNWLMAVAKKCFALNNENDKYESIYYALADLDIDRVYNACVNFIKWYNKNK